MFSLRKFAAFLVVSACYIVTCRSDPVEGSRLLEEAFRDYDKRIRPNYGGSPVVVNVSVYILSLPEIDTSSNTFKISFFIRQMWTDPRFFFNSRRNIDTITLDASTSDRIWSPDTFFVNELSSVSHEVLVKNQFCRISQNGSVLLSRRVTLTAFSPMDASLFPYDSHTLSLDMESYGSQTKDMKYQWGEEEASSGSLQIPGFLVGKILATDTSLTTSTGSYSRLTITIKAKRNPLAYELGFILPIALLALLCWGSLYISNVTSGTVTTMFLVSLITVMNGLLLVNGGCGSVISGVPCMSPLQLHALLSCGFGFICLIVNIKRENRFAAKRGNVKESKSRTESTSENCKADELPYGSTMDDNQCVTVPEQNHSKLIRCLKKCRRESCVRCSLLVLLLTMNLLCLLAFRLIR